MRNLSGAVITAIQQEQGERVYLIELEFSGGSIYLTTGSQDLVWDGHTWDAAGGALSIGTIEETGETKGGGVDIALSGLDQSITAILLSQQYRGRLAQVWQVVLNPTTGVVTDAFTLFDGLQLDNYEIEEKVERGKPVSCTIRTRARHRLAAAEFRGIRANVHSHQQYYPGDTFFKHVASFANRKIYWGTEAPEKSNPLGPIGNKYPVGGGGNTGGAGPDDNDRTKVT